MEETKKKIFIASKKLFELYSPKKVSIDMIVDEAGVGKGTFYNYFKNKEDVYEQIVDAYMVEQHVQEKCDMMNELPLEEQLVSLFIMIALIAFENPIIKNFFLKNENFFIGKIDYNYLKTYQKAKLSTMFAHNYPDGDTEMLSQIVWWYSKEMIQKKEELDDTQMEQYLIRYASLLVAGYLADYDILERKIDMQEVRKIAQEKINATNI